MPYSLAESPPLEALRAANSGAGAALDLLDRWLRASLAPERYTWLCDQISAVRAGTEGSLVRAIGLVPRRLGKADLALPPGTHDEARAVVTGFDPTGLSIDQAARIALLLASYRDDTGFAATIEDLARTADLQELLALYRGLAVFPAAPLLQARAREGVRSGIRPVFEAIAHRNPYPRVWFDELAWNQMVLKALFMGSALAPIQGLDERANPDLATTLVDYAQERWAASRQVPPELWRCVGPFADERALAALERVLVGGSDRERHAATLALAACRNPRAMPLLAQGRGAVAAAPEDAGTWTAQWDAIAESTGA